MIFTIPTEVHFYECQHSISNVIKSLFLQLLTENTFRTAMSKKEKPETIYKVLDA